MEPARKQRDKEARRNDIVVAAETVFSEKGVEAATMDDIAQRAGLSKGTLYLYFDSKDELYLTIAIRELEALHERFAQALAEGADGFERLAAVMRAYAAYAQERPQRFRVVVSWLLTSYTIPTDTESFGRYRELMVAVFGTVEQVIAEGQRDGTIQSDLPAAQLSVQLWGGGLGVLMLRNNARELAKRIPQTVDLDALIPGFIDVALRGVRA